MDEYTAEARADDESIFVIPRAALDPIHEALSTALQAVLRRKVWIVEDAPIWVRQAHPFT